MSVLTILDIAKRNGSDAMTGLVEEILNVAPELRTLPAVPKAGTGYKITRRTGLPAGAFRNANEGVDPGKSTYEQRDVPMFFFDAQLSVDEAIVKGDDRAIGDILADEAAGQIQDAYQRLGDQIYRGVTADAKGFAGFRASVDTTNMVVNATGSGSNATETVWAVREDTQGVYLPVGQSGFMSMGEWTRQQVTDTDGKKYFAWVNNLSFYIGLCIASNYAIGCVKNVTSAAPFTDALAAELMAKFPVGKPPTRWFMSRNSAWYLQRSRATTAYTKDDGRGAGSAPKPTETQGVPISVTDAIAKVTNW